MQLADWLHVVVKLQPTDIKGILLTVAGCYYWRLHACVNGLNRFLAGASSWLWIFRMDGWLADVFCKRL